MKYLSIHWFTGLLLCASASAAATDARPNVLLIVSDDLNCRLGCYGAAEAKTPNIDRLAARGVRFDRAYCNYPVCNVSRTSFLSGRYPEVTGVLNNNTDPRIRLGAEFQFLPEYFRAQGYFTAGCGKIAHGAYNSVVKWDYYSEPQRGGDEDDAPRVTKQKGAKKGGKKGKTAAAPAAGTDVPFPWQATVNDDAGEPDGQVARASQVLSARCTALFHRGGFAAARAPHGAAEIFDRTIREMRRHRTGWSQGYSAIAWRRVPSEPDRRAARAIISILCRDPVHGHAGRPAALRNGPPQALD